MTKMILFVDITLILSTVDIIDITFNDISQGYYN